MLVLLHNLQNKTDPDDDGNIRIVILFLFDLLIICNAGASSWSAEAIF